MRGLAKTNHQITRPARLRGAVAARKRGSLLLLLMVVMSCGEDTPVAKKRSDGSRASDAAHGPAGDAAADAGRDASSDAGGAAADAGRDAASDAGGADAGAGQDAGEPRDAGGANAAATAGLWEGCSLGDAQCAPGLYCQHETGRCCPLGQHCCEQASDCPDSYRDERGCDDAASCRGSVEAASCTDHVCESAFVASEQDASGCAGMTCAPGSCSEAVATPLRSCDAQGECTGRATSVCPHGFACDGSTCATSCEQGTGNGCADGYLCGGDGGCVLDQNPGADCSAAAGGPSICRGGLICNGDNQRCCAEGQACCQQPADCPDHSGGETYRGALCADTASCGGELRTAVCEDHRCGYSAVEQAAQCDAMTCDGGVCESGRCRPRRIGQPCTEDRQCSSGECAPWGACRGAPGEPCNPAENNCLLGGACRFGDAQGATFRCVPQSCLEQLCSYWEGDEDSGSCSGAVQPFTTPHIGSPLVACYDDGGGMRPHEAGCSNAFDEDFDGLIDVEDPDCQPGTGDFWELATGRGPRALCQPQRCGSADESGSVQCASGVGGCFDAACHSHFCWPDAGQCAGRSSAETVCKWWDSAHDLDNSCDASELLDRPDGSPCGFGCSCEAGVGAEFLCADGRDNDHDGLLDGEDSDCSRQHGDPCFAGGFNGAPDAGNQDALVSGYVASGDQCEGDALCWCAEASCVQGVCLDEQADCMQDGSFVCNYYADPVGAGCGSATARPNGIPALPSNAARGMCQDGALSPIGAAAPGETCSAWSDCASGFCMCGDTACATRVCWAADDCLLNACFARVGDGDCQPLDTSVAAIRCGDGVFGAADVSDNCACAQGGVMLEIGCDDGITNDWPQLLSLSPVTLDTAADWYDTDCYVNPLGGSESPHLRSLRDRYR